MHFRRQALRGIEHVQHFDTAAALQAGARQAHQVADAETTNTVQPALVALQRRQQAYRQAMQAAMQAIELERAAAASTCQQPGAARGGRHAQHTAEAEFLQAAAHQAAQAADAAEQAQAGAHVQQQGGALAFRHLRRVLQHGHGDCVQCFFFLLRGAFVHPDFRRQHQGAAAAHAGTHAHQVGAVGNREHALLFQHHAAQVIRPVRTEHFER